MTRSLDYRVKKVRPDACTVLNNYIYNLMIFFFLISEISFQQYLQFRRGEIELSWKCAFCVKPVPSNTTDADARVTSLNNAKTSGNQLPEIMDISPGTSLCDEIDDVKFDVRDPEFTRPMASLNDVFLDTSLDDVILEDRPVEYEIVEGGTTRGAPMLVSTDCYSYTRWVRRLNY